VNKKINKMEAKAIEAQIDKLKATIDTAEGKRTKGDESPSRRYRHLCEQLLTMKKAIIILAITLLCSSQAANIMIETPRPPPKKTIKARITAYWLGEDEFGWKSSTGKRLVSGKSCAVDPRLIPYGTKLIIEGKTYHAHDTGTAVISRKASGKSRLPVVDLFYASERQARRELARVGRTAVVEIQ
jgi:3D (Asp-Asp-Asp) domain-containing protein